MNCIISSYIFCFQIYENKPPAQTQFRAGPEGLFLLITVCHAPFQSLIIYPMLF